MADGLLNKASIILTPTGYKAGTLYNVAPVVEPYEDFDFARASVASRVNSSGLVEMVGRTLGSELVQNGDFSQLGSELVTDGDFPTPNINWSVVTGWSVSGGSANYDDTINGQLSQAISLNSGTYKLNFNISNSSGSGARIWIGNAIGNTSYTDNTYEYYTNGDYSIYINVPSNQTTLAFWGNTGGSSFSIDNVSVKQVDPNDYWTLGTGVTIEEDKLKIDGGALQGAEQNNVITSGLSCKVTFTVSDYVSGTVNLRHPLNKEVTANGTYTFYGDANSAKVLIRGNAVSNEFNITNISVKEVIDTNNIPRISYDSNGDNGHILLEPTSTNLLPYSEDFSQWASSNLTLTSGQSSAITSSNDAWLFTATASLANVTLSVSSSGANTLSVFAKAGTQDGIFIRFSGSSNPRAFFNLTNGTLLSSSGVTSSNVEAFNDGWYRISITGTDNVTDARIYVADSTGNFVSSGNIYVQNAQLEELSYATSYIPTLTGSTETRATETATGAGSADLINSTEGVLYAEIAALDDSSISIGMCDGSTDNRVLILLQSNNTIRGFVESSDTIVFDEIYQVSSTLDYHKIAIKYKANDFALWIDGVERDTDTNGAIPIGLNELLFNNGGGGSAFYGKCKALAVFNEALSDSELNNLTG